jgi:hypothetical protein
MKMSLMVCLALVLSGCSAPSIRCDSHLRPINPPGANTVPFPASPVQNVP